jgi:hypothetical protein
MIRQLMFAGLLATVLAQQAPAVCPSNCADCRSVNGVVSCYGCFRSTFSADKKACSGPALKNCLIVNLDGLCTQCESGFALDTANNDCDAVKKINGCVLEQVDNPNKCIICNGSFPTDDLTACGKTPFADGSDCLWGTVLGRCARCRYDNLMAAYSGECVGRYLYGCLQENGVNRCNGCDHDQGFYMKFPTLCWK